MTILAGIGIFLSGVAVGMVLISLSAVTRKYFDENNNGNTGEHPKGCFFLHYKEFLRKEQSNGNKIEKPQNHKS